jgi:hypothetical protein
MQPVADRDRIYRVDPRTGALTLLGTTGFGQSVAALALGPENGLLGIQSNGVLISIDGATGAGTALGSTGIVAPMALALRHGSSATGVASGPSASVPDEFMLEQNFPNPFNPSTSIRFHIPGARTADGAVSVAVTLVVYDMLGREVAVLIDERLAPGMHSADFDASRLASGVYLYRLTAGGSVATRKMVLTR